MSEIAKEQTINLKTLFADLNEIEHILDTSLGALEYLVDGSASDSVKPESSANPTVTLSMLHGQIITIRKLAGNNQGLINRLTGK